MRAMIATLFIVCLCAYSAQAKIYQCIKGAQIIYQDRPCGKGTDEWHVMNNKGNPIPNDKPRSSSSKSNLSSASTLPTHSSSLQAATDFGGALAQLQPQMPLSAVQALFPAAHEAFGGVPDGLDSQMLAIDNVQWRDHEYGFAEFYFDDWGSDDNPKLTQVRLTNGFTSEASKNQRHFNEDLAYFRQQYGQEKDYQTEDGVFGIETNVIWDVDSAVIQLTLEPFIHEKSTYILRYNPK